MRLNLLFFALFWLVLAKPGFSQGELKVGSRVPSFSIKGFKDQRAVTLKSEDIKSKLIILDFWNIWCASCIAAMPKLDSLQAAYGDKILILMITRNSKEQGDKLFGRIGSQAKNTVYVYGDTLFNKYFPHQGEPYHVWIDSSGIVKTLSLGYNTNPVSIKAYFDGKEWKPPIFTLDSSLSINASLFSIDGKLEAEKLEYRSVLLGNLTNHTLVNKGFVADGETLSGKISMLRLLNYDIASLFNIAFHRSLLGRSDPKYMAPMNRILYEGEDDQFFKAPMEEYLIDEWNDRHLYSYESKTGSGSKKEIFSYMQDDLNSRTGYTGKIERRTIKCLVLQRTGKFDKISTKDPKGGHLVDYQRGRLVIRNGNISELLSSIEASNPKMVTPIIDGSGYSGKIDMTINCRLNDIISLRKELARYDLKLVDKEMEIDMLVIRDKIKGQ